MTRSQSNARPFRFITRAVLPFLVVCTASTARAEANPAKARELFQQAKELRSAGRYDAACAKFERSLALDVGIGTEFNLADCWEHVNRTASAHELFLKVVEHATALQQQDRAAVAQQRADALAPKLTRLALDVGTPQPNLEIRVDNHVVAPAEWADGRAIDPGSHEIRVTAPRKVPWSVRIDAPASGDPIVVSIPALQGDGTTPIAAPARPVVKSEVASPPKALPEEPPAVDKKPEGPSPVLRYGLYAGVGAGLVLAGASLAIYKSTNDQASKICPLNVNCSASEIQRHAELVDNAQTARGLSYVGFGIAGASLVTAVVVAMTTHHPSEKAASAAPIVGPGLLGAAVHGRF
jgi:tetratricopeptide (TPR) repeat protein